MTLFLIGLACSGSQAVDGPVAEVAPVGVAGAMCAVCGMTVDEQPSPRAQVQHRDGQYALLCSVSELQAYLAAPGPLGQPVGTWVEVLPPDLDPALHDTSPRPWRDPSQTWFATVASRRVMGMPVLSYASADDAEAAREAWSASPLHWPSLTDARPP
jgi:nitrous oxide reductase accessory protein NosL